MKQRRLACKRYVFRNNAFLSARKADAVFFVYVDSLHANGAFCRSTASHPLCVHLTRAVHTQLQAC